MGGIFGLTLLKNNKLEKGKIGKIINSLLRNFLGETVSASLVATSEGRIDVIKRDHNLAKFINSPECIKFLADASETQNLYSIIGSFKRRAFLVNTEVQNSIMTNIGKTVCVNKDVFLYNSESTSEKIVTVIDKVLSEKQNETPRFHSMFAEAAKVGNNTQMYACVNAFYPSLTIITKHTVDPLYISLFEDCGVVVFSSLRNSLVELKETFNLGEMKDIEICSKEAMVICAKNNTIKEVNIFAGLIGTTI